MTTALTPIRFTKMHGIGNDYIYINCFEQRIDDPVSLAKVMSDRHTGVGGDGIILICPPSGSVSADVRMRMFNADGSESEMCGNGIRCVCKYAHDHGLSKTNPMCIETGRGVLSLNYTLDTSKKVDQVTVDMGAPLLAPDDVGVRHEFLHDLFSTLAEMGFGDALVARNDAEFDSTVQGVQATTWMLPGQPAGDRRQSLPNDAAWMAVSTGNPHIVFFVRDAAKIPLAQIGPLIELHHSFPRRINVHVVQVHSRREISMRTWERGTGITLACGTGASAVCVAGASLNLTDREILAHLPGGDLRLRWDKKTNHVFKTGPAVEVFDGIWAMNSQR